MERIADKIAAWLREEAASLRHAEDRALVQAFLDDLAGDVERGNIRIDVIGPRIVMGGSGAAVELAVRFAAFLDDLAAEEIASRRPETGAIAALTPILRFDDVLR